jgi:predicted  nucleic acid-binding Zn-ribbon protein
MSQPEISHRCPACGVSIRDFDERALFCPECGQPLVTEETDETNIVTENAAETNEIQSQPVVTRADDSAAESAAASDAGEQPEVEQPLKEEPSKLASEEVAPPKGDEPPKDETPKLAAEEVAEPAIDPYKAPRHGARERTRETLHRASNVARGAIEDNVKRVEKIHHVSSVMFEEAHYDPSLRFVLVALGLFLVFVLLLVLSKVMG